MAPGARNPETGTSTTDNKWSFPRYINQALVLRSSLALPRLIVACRSCQVANYHQVLPINDVGQAALTPLGEKMDSRDRPARLTQSLVTDVEER